MYVDSLTSADLEFVALEMHPCIPPDVVTKMVKFNSRLTHETNELHLWGQKGSLITPLNAITWVDFDVEDEYSCQIRIIGSQRELKIS